MNVETEVSVEEFYMKGKDFPYYPCEIKTLERSTYVQKYIDRVESSS